MGHVICVGVLDAEWSDQRGAVAHGVARTDSVLSEGARAQPKYSPVEQIACPELILSKVEGRSRRIGATDDAVGAGQGRTQRRKRRSGPRQRHERCGQTRPAAQVGRLGCSGRGGEVRCCGRRFGRRRFLSRRRRLCRRRLRRGRRARS